RNLAARAGRNRSDHAGSTVTPRRYYDPGRGQFTITASTSKNCLSACCSNVIPMGGGSRKDTAMINKIAAVLTAVLIFGSASAVSAATIHKPVRHHGYAAATNAAVHFQNNWNVSY